MNWPAIHWWSWWSNRAQDLAGAHNLVSKLHWSVLVCPSVQDLRVSMRLLVSLSQTMVEEIERVSASAWTTNPPYPTIQCTLTQTKTYHTMYHAIPGHTLQYQPPIQHHNIYHGMVWYSTPS